MDVRVEQPGDVAAIAAVHGAAFPTPEGAAEPVEVGLVEALRADAGWVTGLSLVAVEDGEVVGHVVCSQGLVGDTPALGLGPIGVLPAAQGRGVGAALMTAVLDRARAGGWRVVALLGSDWYARFGFVPASRLGIHAPDPAWGDHFQALVLDDGPAPAGTFAYAAPFTAL